MVCWAIYRCRGGGGGRKRDVQGGREEALGSTSLKPIDGCAFTGSLYGFLILNILDAVGEI